MSFEVTAAADLSAKLGYCVKQSAPGQVNLCTAVTDVPFGILENKPTSGRPATVTRVGRTKAVIGATVTAGDLLGPDATSRLVKKTPGTDITNYVHAFAGESGTVGQLIDVELIPVPHRAA